MIIKVNSVHYVCTLYLQGKIVYFHYVSNLVKHIGLETVPFLSNMAKNFAERLKVLIHVQSIYNRLYVRNQLNEACKDCPVMGELCKIKAITEELVAEVTESDIGYCLNVKGEVVV